MARVVIVGAGMMGSALAWPLADAGHTVTLIGTPLDGEVVDAVRRGEPHPKLGLRLPSAATAAPPTELEAACRGADAIAVGVSSAGIPWAASALAGKLRPSLPLFMITKGLVWNGHALCCLPDALRDALPDAARLGVEPVGVAGPCIAGELARGAETMVVLTGRDPGAVERVRALLAGKLYHPRASADVIGVEICAALKNAYALGIALPIGMNEARGGSTGSIGLHNLESAIFAQAVREMARVVQLAGGDPGSAYGLAGVGDLDVTCNGGRTGRFGRQLGLGVGRDRAIAALAGATLECLEILAVMRPALSAWRASGALGAGELPLLDHLAAVALDDETPAPPIGSFFA
jgi:glycerol-3-phosphate dehydrogenase (NAD(P)+)